LGNSSVNAEVKASLYLELLKFIAYVLDHLIQFVKKLFMKPDDVSQKISLSFLGFNGRFQLGDLDRVVGGQCECSSGSDERGNVPLSSLMFWNVRKACQKILEDFEDLTDVRFVEFESALQCSPVLLIKVKVETIEVWNAAIHTLDHFVLKLQKSRVVKRDPDMA
jgi:hypothetical protein